MNFDALRIIETLRSGVPSRMVSAFFPHGREKILDKVRSDLQQVKEDGISKGLIIQGQYGDGKTHLLNQIFNEAQAQNFVVSSVALSKETPFNDLRRVYQKAAPVTITPGSPLHGFERQLGRQSPSSETISDLLTFSETAVHKKIHYVLKNYFREDESYNRFVLYNDLLGDFVPVNTLRSIHSLNFREKIQMGRFILKEHLIDYFKFLGYMFKKLEFSGWVILFDEAELIGKLGRVSRAMAYKNLGQLLNLDNSGLKWTYVVFAFASPFFNDVLVQRNDYETSPTLLEEKGQIDSARLVRKTLDQLGKTMAIEPLPEDTIQDILQTIARLHGEAYNWSSQLDIEYVLRRAGGTQTRLRTKIRAAIEYLDLTYLYGSAPAIDVKELDELHSAEDRDFFSTENQDEGSKL